MAEFSNLLFELGEISGHDIFIDGTKIESFANKYTFVWKRSVTKRMAKLGESLSAFVQACEDLYGIKVAYTNEVKIYHLKKLRKKLYAIKAAEGVTFVHGSGKRKTGLQKSIETLNRISIKSRNTPGICTTLARETFIPKRIPMPHSCA